MFDRCKGSGKYKRFARFESCVLSKTVQVLDICCSLSKLRIVKGMQALF